MTTRRKPASSPAISPSKSKGIIVLGMHRSGTSAAARVLNLLGCALPVDLIGPSEGNELGHWESLAANTLNDEILGSAGSNWQDWGPINQDWRQSGLRADMVARIARVLQDHAALGPLFVLKDPRICRLADLWLEGMDTVGVQPLVVLMMRNPLEVVASLESRDLMADGYGQLLWLRHMLDAEYFSRGRRRVLVRYDQLLRNWFGVIDRIKSGLGVAFPRNAPAIHAQIDEFLNNKYRHHEVDAAAILNNPRLSAWLRETFGILMAWSEQGENVVDHASLDRIRYEFDQAHSTFARLLMRPDFVGDYAIGSQLKRDLHAQLEAAKQAANAAHEAMQEAEARQAETASREAELQARLSSQHAEAARLQADIDALRPKAELAEHSAIEADALRARAEQLSTDVARLEAALEASSITAEQERQQRLAADRTLASQLTNLQELELRNAELTGRAASAESALVQRQEELSQLWGQLLVVEKAAAVAESQAALDREQREELQRRLAAADASNAELRAELEEQKVAAFAADSSRAQSEQRLAEHVDKIAELTAMLAEATAQSAAAEASAAALRTQLEQQRAAARAADAARAQSEQRLVERFEEIASLTSLLADADASSAKVKADVEELRTALEQQKAAARAADAARAQSEQRLVERFNEIASLTSMLADASARSATSNANSEWLRSMMQVAAGFPPWWALMPEAWRRKREHARYRRSGLFNAERYLETYPDVADHGMDPVRHYILHGLAEGRVRPT